VEALSDGRGLVSVARGQGLDRIIVLREQARSHTESAFGALFPRSQGEGKIELSLQILSLENLE
jgi:hypothetical protein